MSKLLVCDFDDTLCKSSDLSITLTDKSTREKSEIKSSLWNSHVVDTEKYEYDWSQFNELSKTHKPINKILKIVKNWYTCFGGDSIVILTARNSPKGPIEFTKIYGLGGVKVVALGLLANNSRGKADWIKQEIVTKNITYIEYYEDNDAYINEVKKLRLELPNITLKIYKVKSTVS